MKSKEKFSANRRKTRCMQFCFLMFFVSMLLSSLNIFSQELCRPALQTTLSPASGDKYLGTGQPGFLVQRAGIGNGVISKRITQHSDFSSIAWRIPPVHAYSRLQAWSLDNSTILISGSPVNASTYAVSSPFALSSEERWGESNNLLYGFTYQTSKFYRQNPDGSGLTLIRDFGLDGYNSGSNSLSIGYWEGNNSFDDRYWLFVGNKGDVETMLVYDMQDNVIVGQKAVGGNMNWASVTRTGKYVVALYNSSDIQKRISVRYDLNFANPTVLDDWSEHNCLYVDENGDDWLFGVGYPWYSVRIKDKAHLVFNLSDFGHCSAATKKPGYVAFSTESTGLVGILRCAIDSSVAPVTRSRNYNMLGFSGTLQYTEYNGLEQVEIWGYFRSVYNTYNAYPMASVNREATKILVHSNWYGGSEINTYEFSLTKTCGVAAPSIVLLTDDAHGGDVAINTFLTDNGFTVNKVLVNDALMAAPTPGFMNTLNSADLVVCGRDAYSNVQNAVDSTTTPVIHANPYGAQWGSPDKFWFTNASMNTVSGKVQMAVTNDPIFTYSNVVADSIEFSIGTAFVLTPDTHNGDVISSYKDGLGIVRFKAGVPYNSAPEAKMPYSDHTIFPFETGTNTWTLLHPGQAAFYAEIRRMLGLEIEEPTSYYDLYTAVEPLISAAVNVYPNPAKDYTTVIGLEGQSIIRVYNINGKLVSINRTGNTESRLDLTDLMPGMYLIKVDMDGKSFSSKILKE